MFKFLRFMLVTVLSTLCGSMLAQEEKTATWLSSSGDALTTIFVGDDVSLKWDAGNGEFAPKYSNGNVYFYNGNRLVVSGASDEVKITKVVFTFASEKYSMVTCDKNGKNESSVGITNNAEEKTCTWTGEQNSIIFRAPARTNDRKISAITVTYTGSAGQVEKTPKLAITNDGIADTYDMDANGVFVVYYANNGVVAAENAKLTLYVDGAENASKTIGTLNVGESNQNFWNAKYNLTNIEAGEHQVYLALTASNAEAFNTTAKTVNFTKKAPEATFSISAANVTVPYNATSYNVVAKLKNTSTVNATDVLVQLRKGISESVAEQTVESLVAGAETNVTLTVENGPFDAGTKTYYLYVNGKYLSSVDVTVEKAPVVDVYDLAVTDITGTLDLANESNNVRIIVQNNGNKDVIGATVTLKAGDKTLGTATVSATAGNTGWCTIAVASEGLEAGTLNVTATVDVENDATPDDNTKEATLTVKAKPVPVATFVLSAAPVEVDYGAETVAIVVNVKNNSEVDATEELTLNLWNNGIVATEKAAALKAGEETTVTFTIANPLTAPGSKELQVLSADNKYGCYVTITMKEAPLQVGVTSMVAAASEYNIKAADYAGAAFTITVKNYDANNAAKATVQLLKVGSNDVLATSTVSLDADEEKSVLMNYKATEAGKIKFYAKVLESTHYQATWPASSAVEVNFFEAAEGVDLTISATPAATVDLDNGAFVSATYANNGTVAAESAVLKLFVDGEENAAEVLGTIAAGQSGFKSIAYDVAKIAAGEHEVYVALIAGENEVKTEAVKVTFTKKAAEAAFTLTAADVEAELTAETVSVVVNVKNTSDVAAENVEVKLYNGIDVLGTQTIAALAAGENKDVTFTFANFGKAGKYDLQAIAGKYSCWVKVTVKEASEEEKIDMALTQIQGVSEINLKRENKVMVWYKNESNVAVATATISAKLNDIELEAQTIENIKVEGQGYVEFTLPVEGLTAGETATFVATIVAEGDTNAENNEVSKTLAVVSGETAPQADIVLNNIANQELEPGEQTVNVTVGVFNNGDADAENVEINLYKSYPTILATQTVSVKAGESAVVSFSFDYTFEDGKDYEFTVQTLLNDANPDNNTQKFTVNCKAALADLTIAKIANIEATTEDEVKVSATVKNLSADIAAKDVKVALYKGQEMVGYVQTIDEIAAAGEEQVEFNLGKLEAGTYNYTVQITSKDANAENNIQDVTVKVKEAVVEVKDLAITEVLGTIDLANETNNVRVSVENKGNVDITAAPVTLKAGETVLGTATVSAKAGMTGFCLVAVASEGLEAGELAVTATVEVEGDVTPADNTMEAVLTVKAAPVAEPTFSVAAENVSVPFGAKSFEIKAVVKNTSEVAAQGLTVKLLKGITEVESKTLDIILGAGEETEVSFTVNEVGEAGKTATYYVQVENKAQAEVTVTFEQEAVEEVKDLAVTEVLGTIDLANETNNVRVSVENKGTVDITDAAVTLKAGETVLGTATVSAKAGMTGFCLVAVASAGLEAGELAVTATVEVEGDVTPADNTLEATLTVKDAPAAEATLELAVADVTVELADKTVKAVVNVKNTSEVKAEQVDVKLFYGMDQLGETKTVFGLEAGADQNVTFEFANFEQPGTYEVQAIAGTVGKFFNVVVKAPVVDLAIEGIEGTIDLANTSSNVTVTVKNNGTVDMKDAKVTLGYGETVLEKSVSIVAGEQGYAFFQVASAGLEAGELEVTAKVEAENDVTPADNEKTVTLTVKAAPAAEATFAVTAAPVEFELGTEKFDVVATVKNTSDVDAKNVEVKLFHIGVIATQTIETLAAGAEATVTFADVENPYTKAGNYTMYVMAPKAMAEVNITVKEPYVAPVVDLAVTLLQGTLDLTYTTGNISVGVQNKGNQDVKDAVVKLTAGNAILGEKTVNVKAGDTSYAIFSVATEGLTAGELDVTATVIVEGEVTPDDNTMTKTIIVKAAPVAEPTFSVTAQDVSVAYGAESFEIKAVVKNTSDVNASDVEVKLLKSITTVETKTIETLAAGAETTVTFTVNEIGQPGKTATYYVQVAGKAQDEVTVTFEQKPEEKVIDLALTAISGSLSAESETNYLTVFVENKGNVDVTDATVTLKSGDTVLGTATVSAKAGNNGFCSIAVPATAMKDGDFEVTATVEVDGDADLTNNTLTKMVTVVLPDPLVSIYVTDFRVATGATSFAIPVVVKNLRDNYAAKDVKVMIYDNNGKLIGQATIDYLAAGAEETIYVNVELDAPYTENTQLSVWASGFGETKTESFTLVIDDTLVSIDTIKALVNKGVKIYTLSGKQVSNVTKAGLYIVNGRKVYVK